MFCRSFNSPSLERQLREPFVIFQIQDVRVRARVKDLSGSADYYDHRMTGTRPRQYVKQAVTRNIHNTKAHSDIPQRQRPTKHYGGKKQHLISKTAF